MTTEALLLRMLAAQIDEIRSNIRNHSADGLLDDALTRIRKAAEIIE
jgi:hypothetical protein